MFILRHKRGHVTGQAHTAQLASRRPGFEPGSVRLQSQRPVPWLLLGCSEDSVLFRRVRFPSFLFFSLTQSDDVRGDGEHEESQEGD